MHSRLRRMGISDSIEQETKRQISEARRRASVAFDNLQAAQSSLRPGVTATRKAHDPEELYVQYGSGWCGALPLTWRNFDSSCTLRFERLPIIGKFYIKNRSRFPANVEYGDIVKGLPLPARSCAGVYASHVLEHLTQQEFHLALANTFNLLMEGGIFRLVVPDLECATRSYLRAVDLGQSNASSAFLKATGLGQESRSRSLGSMIYEHFRTSRHLWMWDRVSLGSALAAHGFVAVRRCGFNDSEDRRFVEVEQKHRFLNAVAMQGRHP